MDKDVLTPSIFEGCFQVSFPRTPVLDPVQKARLVVLRQFCNELLQDLGQWSVSCALRSRDKELRQPSIH
jgi:hypothetical protein